MNEFLTNDTTIHLQAQDSILARLLTYTEVPGMEGVPIPYQLRTDDGIMSLILLCFFMLTYVLSKGRNFLVQQFKELFSSRERPSFFSEETNTDFRYRFLLVLNTCLVMGLLLFEQCSQHVMPTLSGVALYAGICMVYFAMKLASYAFTNWVLFNKNKQKPWLDAFSLVFGVEGILLFPVLLLLIYFDLSADKKLLFAGLAILFGKILLFCKCANIFFRKKHRSFYLIVYFCAVEIVPCLIFGRAIITISSLHNKIL